MMNIKTLKENQSSFADFESERMSVVELFNTLGGIERGYDLDNITVKELTLEDVVYDPVIPVWSINKTQYEPHSIKGDRNFLSKDNLFSPVRILRTLWLYVYNEFKLKAKQ